MSVTPVMPQEARVLAGFPVFLRDFGFQTAPDQAMNFLEAVDLLGPRSIVDIYHASHAVFAPRNDRRDEFDALFRAYFHGEFEPGAEAARPDEKTIVKDDDQGEEMPVESDAANESGERAARGEILGVREFDEHLDDRDLRRLRRLAPERLPLRRGFRRVHKPSGQKIDLRRTLRRIVTDGGDPAHIAFTRRRPRQRNIVLLIDVSGSMKAQTEDYLRVAQTLTRAADRVETFTFGTRLTRISRAMRQREEARALAEAAAIVEDWDGGTRIGDALDAFLRVPRFAGFVRGALTVVISDGLERGDHGAMVDAVARLSRRAWRLAWLTPLAADPQFEPKTAAMQAVLPQLDDLASAGSIADVCDYILSMSRDNEKWRASRWLRRVEDAA